MVIEQIIQGFNAAFGEGRNVRVFHSPGRVNLIGEHIDYNGGYVFPCALSLGTYGAVRRRGDGAVRFASGNIDLPVTVELSKIKFDEAHGWANYPKGVLAEFIRMGHGLGGFDLYIWGDIPNGAGLSSSASLELLTSVVVNTLFDCGVPMKEMVLLSQSAENNFVGVNCGVMDQYAVGFGKEGHAILLDCGKISHEYAPFELNGYKMIIANTNKRRGLVDSKYNERRGECDEAVRILRKAADINYLCELDIEGFEKLGHTFADAVIYNRAKHAVYENARVLAAVEALNQGDLARFGALMNESHISLRDLYEVTGKELDALAEAAWQADGVVGSRMTGAGFGGCTISIVREENVTGFIESVGAEYTRRTGLTADFYAAETGDGAREIHFGEV